MWIKLISPRVTMRPMDSEWKTHMSPPLGLLVLGSLTPPHHRVTLADECVESIDLTDHPDLVGITVKVDTMYRAAEIAARYRARGVPVVMGGIHATACPDDCCRHADAVVIGEAEEIWARLLDDAEHGELKPLYRSSSAVDMEKTPIPLWPLVDEKNYLFTNTLCVSRGCPWICDFCYNSAENVDSRYRTKPVRNVVKEIESLGVQHVMFIDDNFIGDPGYARCLLQTMRDMNLTWHTAVSANIGQHEDLLDLMAETGCRSLFIGFESVNQNSLLNCHKKQNRIGSYDDTIRKIHDRGIMVNASVAFGFDDDDGSVFSNTVDWLVRNRVETVTGHILTPYPGTRLYDQLEREGRIVDRNLEHYNTAHAVFLPKKMSRAELEEGYMSVYRSFYSWANIWNRRPESAAQWTAYLEFNLLYRKFGHVTSRLGKWFGMRRLAKLAKAVAYPARWRHPRVAARPTPAFEIG